MDITPKRCESVGCKYAANFGDTTQRTRRFCARHKLGGMLSYQELVSGWVAREEGAIQPINVVFHSLYLCLESRGAAVVTGENQSFMTRSSTNLADEGGCGL